jgi:hypothetical protein
MNSFSLYLILQLDSIGATLTVISIIVALATAVIALVAFFAMIEGADEILAKALVYTKKGAIAALILFGVNAFLPSSKTAAVMVVLPAVANNENIQREAGELYQIAKQGLTDLVKKAAAPKGDTKEPTKDEAKPTP